MAITLPHTLCAHLPDQRLCRSSASPPPLQAGGLAGQPHVLSFNTISSGSAAQLAASPPHAVTASVFEAEAPAGLVECFSRGCRPVLHDDDAGCNTSYDNDDDAHSPLQGASTLRSRVDAEEESSRGLMPCQIERLLCSGVWAECTSAERYYESALQLEPRNSPLLVEYALFAWNALADAPRADNLFRRAVNLAPSDPTILASYASFLWETES